MNYGLYGMPFPFAKPFGKPFAKPLGKPFTKTAMVPVPGGWGKVSKSPWGSSYNMVSKVPFGV